MTVAPTRRASTLRDMDLIVRGGSPSGLGRTLRSTKLWGGDTSIRDLRSKEIDQVVEDLLRAAATHGLVSEESTPFDQPGWRLNDACVLFQLGDSPADGSDSKQNAFFRDLYANLARMLSAPMHPLFGFEVREHTAQVDSDNREIRENRFLPVLFCSPALDNVVHSCTLASNSLRPVAGRDAPGADAPIRRCARRGRWI